MIIRIVRMTFQPGKTDIFLNIFEQSKHHIRRFSGCQHLELLQDIDFENAQHDEDDDEPLDEDFLKSIK